MENVPNLIEREDRISKYLENIPNQYVFDELSEDFIARNNIPFMKGIAVPYSASDYVSIKEGKADPSLIVDNMAMILGSNISFPYLESYMKFMAKFFNEKLVDVYASNGANALIEQRFKTAIAYYRMALLLNPKHEMSMFGYACACREWYLSLEGEDGVAELIEDLKKESVEFFEWCIIEHPQFAGAYYYLGFAYLNAALYGKTQVIWTRFVELSEDKTKTEVQEIISRLAELEDPVKIEDAINKLTTGNIESGLKILEPYVDSQYKDWWPLHFYLASAYRELEHPEEAIEGYKKVLALNPSNYDACKALAEIYEEQGNEEMATKYLKKSDLLLHLHDEE